MRPGRRLRRRLGPGSRRGLGAAGRQVPRHCRSRMGRLRDTGCWIRRVPMREASSLRAARRRNRRAARGVLHGLARARTDKCAGPGSGVPGANHLGNIRSALDWCSSQERTRPNSMSNSHPAHPELFLELNLLDRVPPHLRARALCPGCLARQGRGHEMVLHGSLGRALLLTDNSGGDTDAHFQRALADRRGAW